MTWREKLGQIISVCAEDWQLMKEDIKPDIIRGKHYFKALPGKIKGRFWNKRLLLWWYRLWLRKNEFHKSLMMDTAALMEMTPEEQQQYIDDLARRRQLAHEKDMD